MLKGEYGNPETSGSGQISTNLEKDSGGIEEIKNQSNNLHAQMAITEEKPDNSKRLVFS